MRTKTLLLACGLLLTFTGSAAQDNTAPKPENQTAVTPVENIRLNGVLRPMNIKTLAEIQRLQEEQTMREELTSALRAGGSVVAAPVAPTAQNVPAVTAKAAPSPVKAKAKTTAPVRPNTLIGVYGTPNAMTAEIQTASRTVRTLRVGEQLGKFNIRRISNEGLELAAGNGNVQYVSVGSQVRF